MEIEPEETAASEAPNAEAVLLKIDGEALHGVLNSDRNIEWEWSRVAANIKLSSNKPYLMLKRWGEDLAAEFAAAEIPWSQYHYRGMDASKDKGHHTFESRALILILALVPMKRSTSPETKYQSLHLLKGLVTKTFENLVLFT